MTTPTQQVSDAQSAGQAVATATPAPVTPTQIQPPQPAPQEPTRSFGMTDAEYAKQLRDESLKRKGKIKALKGEVAQRAADLEQTAKERDALKTAAADYEARFTQLNAKRSEDALVLKLREEGLTEAAARRLIPSMKQYVTVDQKTFDISFDDKGLKEAVAEIKPPQPPAPAVNGAQRLHSLNAAARTEPTAPQPTSWKDRLKAESMTLPK